MLCDTPLWWQEQSLINRSLWFCFSMNSVRMAFWIDICRFISFPYRDNGCYFCVLSCWLKYLVASAWKWLRKGRLPQGWISTCRRKFFQVTLEFFWVFEWVACIGDFTRLPEGLWNKISFESGKNRCPNIVYGILGTSWVASLFQSSNFSEHLFHLACGKWHLATKGQNSTLIGNWWAA